MANTNQLTDLVSDAAAAIFHTKSKFINTVSRNQSKNFEGRGVETGDTIRIPKPAQYTSRFGRVAYPQDTVVTKVPLTVYQINASAYLTSVQKKLDFHDFQREVAMPLAMQLLRKVETFTFQQINMNVMNCVGTPGSTPGTYKVFADARIQDQNVPDPDMVMAAVSNSAMATLTDNVKALYGPRNEIDNAFIKANIKNIAGLDMYQTSSILRLQGIALNSGAPAVATTSVNGATSIALDGFTSPTTVYGGSKFTIANVYAVDPESKKVLPWLQMFTVITDFESDAYGNLNPANVTTTTTATVNVYPAIYGPNTQQQTVSKLPEDGDLLSFVGSSSGATASSFYENLVYDKSAIEFVSLAVPDYELKGVSSSSEKEGIKVRAAILPDGRNDQELIRVDVLVGAAAVRPEWCAMVTGE